MKKVIVRTSDGRGGIVDSTLDELFDRNKCGQCGTESAWLSDVCMKCARKNHRKATGS